MSLKEENEKKKGCDCAEVRRVAEAHTDLSGLEMEKPQKRQELLNYLLDMFNSHSLAVQRLHDHHHARRRHRETHEWFRKGLTRYSSTRV